tara:strand:- start:497 stop:1054 length:558 start_codon:yes stop_codon:yes gene_type:complete
MKERLIFLGPPGVGKGTQAALLCSRSKFLHLSTGELLRAEVNSQTLLGLKAAALMNKGELVSDDLVLSIVEKQLSFCTGGWLLDGFPRNVSQARALEELLLKLHKPIDAVLSIELDDEILIERMLLRGRTDDTEEIIRYRLEVYRQKTQPLINYYSDLGVLSAIKGEGSVKEVSNSIFETLSSSM